jgi:hypothetical protein
MFAELVCQQSKSRMAANSSANAPMQEVECQGGFKMTSLQKAAHQGSVEMVERALECSAASLDAVGGDGRTAIMTAAAHGYTAVVKAMVEAGADLAATDGDGLTAAQIATAAGHPSIAELLADAASKHQALWDVINGIERERKPAASGAKAAAGLPPELAALLAAGGAPGKAAESPF